MLQHDDPVLFQKKLRSPCVDYFHKTLTQSLVAKFQRGSICEMQTTDEVQLRTNGYEQTESTLLYQDFLEKERVVPNKEAIKPKFILVKLKSSLVTAHIFYMSSFAQKIV
jgi:hypothetical protein